MQSDIILHTGLYKTATTFLQQRVFNRLGIKTILPLSSEMHRLYEIFEKVRKRQLSIAQGRKYIKAYIRPPEAGLLLISNEELFGHDKNLFSDVDWRFEILEQLFDHPRYIITIRRQDAICISSWYQGVKQKNIARTFDEFANTEKLKTRDVFVSPDQNFLLDTDFRCYDYRQLFTPYLKHRDRATIVPIEMLDSQPARFYRLLLRDLSVNDLQIAQLVQLSRQEKLNDSTLDHTALFLLNYLSERIFRYPVNAAILRRLHNGYLALSNDGTKNNSWQTPFVVAYLRTIGRLTLRMSTLLTPTMVDSALPSSSTKRRILKHHTRSNQQLSEMIQIDLHQFGYH